MEKDKPLTQHLEHVTSFDDTEKQPALIHGHVVTAEMDEGAKVMAEAGKVEYTLEEDKAVLKKIDTWILPVLCLVYWIQQLDKSSVSYAAVFDLRKPPRSFIDTGNGTDLRHTIQVKQPTSRVNNTAGCRLSSTSLSWVSSP